MRVIEYLLTVLVIVTLNFALPRAMPGDPFLVLSDVEEEAAVLTEEQRQYYFELYGLDRPMHKQYLSYLGDLLRGDLGHSIYYNESVTTIILRRLPWTLFLVISTVILRTIIGSLLGSISAWCRGNFFDQFLFFNLITISEIPAFITGLLILFVFSAMLGLFPLAGAMSHFTTYSNWWDKLLDILHHAFLPIVTLTLARLGGIYLLARNSVVSVIQKDYLLTAQAKGLSKGRILLWHILRNAMLPIVTRTFLSLGSLVGGAILVENVFNYPGLGLLMQEAVNVHDYTLIQGIFLVVALFVLIANLMADLIYKHFDPRIESNEEATA
ncbi:ABC transporter permease [Fuchsiella alkaliacetigena]|uniref:ABC transporter permease n=1 Tax=Fuchsiella alkaliacetigena TaxID=957042 RepID=UPI00355714BC|nr:ABC transporter permease [Fuchsiella alkaliacetigena]